MKNRLFLTLSFLCLIATQMMGQAGVIDHTEHVWFGERLDMEYASSKYYIYSVGHRKFLTPENGNLVEPDEKGGILNLTKAATEFEFSRDTTNTDYSWTILGRSEVADYLSPKKLNLTHDGCEFKSTIDETSEAYQILTDAGFTIDDLATLLTVSSVEDLAQLIIQNGIEDPAEALTKAQALWEVIQLLKDPQPLYIEPNSSFYASAQGQAYRFVVQDALWGITDAIKWKYAMGIGYDDEGNEQYQSVSIKNWNSMDASKQDDVKFLLISKKQIDEEVSRLKKVKAITSWTNNMDVTCFLINPTIIQTQKHLNYMPFGWYSDEDIRPNKDGNVTSESGGILNLFTETKLINDYDGEGYNFDYYQMVTLPAGRYKFQSTINYSDSEGSDMVLYAVTDKGETQTLIKKANLKSSGFLIKTYWYEVELELETESVVRLGVKMLSPAEEAKARTLTADDFKLTFLTNTNATSPEAYWQGEEPVEGQEYYLYNVGTGKYIALDKTTPVDTIADAAKFTWTAANKEAHGHRLVTTVDGKTYEVMISYAPYNAHVHSSSTIIDHVGAGSTGFTTPDQYPDGSFTLLSSHNLSTTAGHYLGVDEGEYDAKTTGDATTRWMFISQQKVDNYNEYKQIYDLAQQKAAEAAAAGKSVPKDIQNFLNSPAESVNTDNGPQTNVGGKTLEEIISILDKNNYLEAGDVNLNGITDVQDVTCLVDLILGKLEYKPTGKFRGFGPLATAKS